jgi:hypothetical protein
MQTSHGFDFTPEQLRDVYGRQNWRQLAECGWHGYLSSGRGAFVFLWETSGATSCNYQVAAWFTSPPAVISTYDPKTSVVLMVVDRAIRTSDRLAWRPDAEMAVVCSFSPAPPDACRLVAN